MARSNYLFVVFFLITLPTSAVAAVRINEIAWMGTKISANSEWIELANDGNKSVNLSGWILKPKIHSTPTITFPKDTKIAARGFFLLERTRDSTVPNIPADLIYTGSLRNGGETLVLMNTSSTVIDTVVGGEKWCAVGGNNKTKETAQRTENGWITATGTPRAANATVGTAPPCAISESVSSYIKTSTSTSSTDVGTTASTTTNAAASTQVQHHTGPPSYAPVPKVFLDVGSDKTVIAGADTKFTALVSDGKGKQYTDAEVRWAFGDGSSAASASVFKSYNAPGTYLVTVTAVEGLGSGEGSIVVTARDADVRVQAVSPSGITIKNNSGYRLDLSFWRLRSGTTTFALPEGTEMLPRTAVLFPKVITHLPFTKDVALLYPNGKKAAVYGAVKDAAVVLQTHSVQPAATTNGSNNIQVGAPVSHISTNAQVYDKTTTVIAPTPAADAAGVGARYGATAYAALSHAAASSSQRDVLSPVTPRQSHTRSFFSSSLVISLAILFFISVTVLILL